MGPCLQGGANDFWGRGASASLTGGVLAWGGSPCVSLWSSEFKRLVGASEGLEQRNPSCRKDSSPLTTEP